MDHKNLSYKNDSLSIRRKRALLAKKRRKAKKLGLVNSVPPQKDLKALLNYFQNNRFDSAIKLGFAIIENFPDHPFAWNILGAALVQEGRFEEALWANQQFVALSPKDPNAHNNLAATLKELGKLNEAEFSYREAISLDQNCAVAYNNLANVLTKKNEYKEAEENYRIAISLKNDYSEAHQNLGNIYCDQGNFAEAKHSYECAIKLNPKFAEAYRMYSIVKKFDSKNKQFSQMLDLYLDSNISDFERAHLCFALGKASEDLEEYDKAFNFFSEGNALRKKSLCYDITKDIDLFNEIRLSYSSFMDKSVKLEFSTESHMPIFIVGMPRSGTTLVEQIISTHSSVSGAGELSLMSRFGDSIARGLQEFNSPNLTKLRKKYIEHLGKFASSELLITDKMPQNFLYLGLISVAFPDAKVIHVRRDPAATCWSNFKHYFTSDGLGYSYNLKDTVAYYSLYQELMNFWEKSFGDRIYHLDYELLTINQEEETKRLIKYLNLDWEQGCLEPQNNKRIVKTSSNAQVTEKVYRGSSKKWEKFKPFLADSFHAFF